MAKLILTDSYFGTFELLVNELKGVNGTNGEKNLIFCEEKISLMTERMICARYGGSFFTQVYSFGNFLRLNKQFDKLLTKEGSAMAVRRVLKDLRLTKFSQNKTNLAPKLYDLIALLKSSNVSVQKLKEATDGCSGVLKEKLADVVSVFSAYEEFLSKNGYQDQSSALSFLPQVIKDKDFSDVNVYLVGYAGFTLQQRDIIKTLIKGAKSVTAILTEGQNTFAYINEASQIFTQICSQSNEQLQREFISSITLGEQALIRDYTFNPKAFRLTAKQSSSVYFSAEQNVEEEIYHVGERIRRNVCSGNYRYRDFSIALPSTEVYADVIAEVFSRLEIPFFLDIKTVPNAHPLIKLITDYIDVKRKNYQRESLLAFFKNPIVCADKNLADDFENYLLAQNVNYTTILKEFNPDSINYTPELEEFRVYLTQLLDGFNVKGLLNKLNVQEKLETFTQEITQKGNLPVASLNQQVYAHVIKILDQMHELIDEDLDLLEYKNTFINGVSALEISLIPQYSDAVYIGGYREVALAQSKKTFAVGLTLGVPNVKEDTALLSDGDITALSEFSCLIEPKIRIINHRVRENVAMALCSYSEELYLSYPVNGRDGKKEKSEIIKYLEKIFTFKTPERAFGYASDKQAIYDFAKDCGKFVEGDCDFVKGSSYFDLAKGQDMAKLETLLDGANSEVKIRLDKNKNVLVKDVVSPTYLEKYYECPYASFLAHGINLKERDTGAVNALTVGNVMHEIFCEYLKGVNKTTEKESADRLFEQLKEKALEKKEYKKFLSDVQTNASMTEALEECKKFCDKFYENTRKSDFSTTYTELKFGDGKPVPAIPLTEGVKMKGSIDRVDTYNDYFRIIDYKTGKIDGKDKSLYAGIKLQLYLYSLVMKDKKLAGLYYMPIEDKYKKNDEERLDVVGKTLADIDIINAQDCNFKESGKSEWCNCEISKGKLKNAYSLEVLQALVDYALVMSKNAIADMKDGVIVPSPYEGSCTYCKFKALCGSSRLEERKISAVKPEKIYNALQGEKDA